MAAAGELGCPILLLNLSDETMTDLALLKLFSDGTPRSLIKDAN